MVDTTQIARINFLGFNRVLVVVSFYDSDGNEIGGTSFEPNFEYGLNPASAEIIAAYTAYTRSSNPARVTYNDTFAETIDEQSRLARLPTPVTLSRPFDWMVDQNYFYQTKLALSGGGGATGTAPVTATGRATLTIKGNFANKVAAQAAITALPNDLAWDGTDFTSISNPTNPIAPFVAFDGGELANAAGQLIFAAFATATAHPDGSWVIGSWFVFQASADGFDIRYTSVLDPSGDIAWVYPVTPPTDWTFFAFRHTNGQWSPPIPRSNGAIVGWTKLGSVVTNFSSVATRGVQIIAAPFTPADYSLMRFDYEFIVSSTVGAPIASIVSAFLPASHIIPHVLTGTVTTSTFVVGSTIRMVFNANNGGTISLPISQAATTTVSYDNQVMYVNPISNSVAEANAGIVNSLVVYSAARTFITRVTLYGL